MSDSNTTNSKDLKEPMNGIARRRSRWRRRRYLLVPIQALVLVSYGVSVATGALNWRIWPTPEDLPPGVEPRPIGSEKVITQGSTEVSGPSGVTLVPWRFTAFESDKGLCLHVEDPRSRGGGCGFNVPSEQAISIGLTQTTNETFLYGPVVKEADRIEVELETGKTVTLKPLGQTLAFDVNFYFTRVLGAEEVRAVVAYDDSDRQLGSATR